MRRPLYKTTITIWDANRIDYEDDQIVALLQSKGGFVERVLTEQDAPPEHSRRELILGRLALDSLAAQKIAGPYLQFEYAAGPDSPDDIELAYVPGQLVELLGPRTAFQRYTGLAPLSVVYFDPDTQYDHQGELWEEGGPRACQCPAEQAGQPVCTWCWEHGRRQSDAPLIPAVVCRVCGRDVRAATAHLHQGQYIGHECCWDERLRASE